MCLTRTSGATQVDRGTVYAASTVRGRPTSLLGFECRPGDLQCAPQESRSEGLESKQGPPTLSPRKHFARVERDCVRDGEGSGPFVDSGVTPPGQGPNPHSTRARTRDELFVVHTQVPRSKDG